MDFPCLAFGFSVKTGYLNFYMVRGFCLPLVIIDNYQDIDFMQIYEDI